MMIKNAFSGGEIRYMKILLLLLFLLFISIWILGFLFSHKIALVILVAVVIFCRMKKRQKL